MHYINVFWDKRGAQYSAFFLGFWFSLEKRTTSKPLLFFYMYCFSLDFRIYHPSQKFRGFHVRPSESSIEITAA